MDKKYVLLYMAMFDKSLFSFIWIKIDVGNKYITIKLTFRHNNITCKICRYVLECLSHSFYYTSQWCGVGAYWIFLGHFTLPNSNFLFAPCAKWISEYGKCFGKINITILQFLNLKNNIQILQGFALTV